jgi:hypothetical protein
MRTKLVLLAALCLTVLGLTACSQETPESPDSAGTSIHITVKDGEVTPAGDRVKAKVGEPITLHIDADTAGEIHVHSTPEQEIEFAEGSSTKELTVEQPGIVDLELHDSDTVIVQLQVS